VALWSVAVAANDLQEIINRKGNALKEMLAQENNVHILTHVMAINRIL